MKPDTRHSQFILRSILVILLIVVTLVLGGILDREIGKRMNALKAQVIAYLEQQLGKKISYESISPSLFMFLEVRDLRIYSSENENEELFRIKTLRVMYNIFTLVANPDPLACVSEINVSNTRFRLDLSRPVSPEATLLQKELLSRLASATYSFRLTGSGVELAIESTQYTAIFSNLFFGLSTHNGAFAIDLTKGKLNLSGSGPGSNDVWVSTNLRVKGSFDPSLENASFDATLTNAASTYLELTKQTFHVTLANNIIDIAKAFDKNPLDIRLVYDILMGKVDIDFRTEGFAPLSMVKFTGPMIGLNEWLDLSTSSHGTVTFFPATGRLDYAVFADVRVGKNPVIPRGTALSATLRGDSARVFFEPLVVRTGKGGIYFNGDVVFAKYFPEGLLNIVNVQLMPGRDVSGLFSIDRTGSGMSLRGESLLVGGMGLYDLGLDLVLKQKSIEYSFAALFEKGNKERHIDLSGNMEIIPAFSLALGGECNGFALSSAYQFMTPDKDYSEAVAEILGNYTVNTDISFSTNLKESVFKTERLTVTDAKNPDNIAVVSIQATPRDFEVNIKNFDWENFHATGLSKFVFSEQNRVSFTSSLIAEEIPYELHGTFEPGSSLTISGSYDLAASFLFKKGSDAVFTARVTKFPFPVHSTDNRLFFMTFVMNGVFSNQSSWRIACPRLVLYDIPLFRLGSNTIETSFTATDGELLFSNIVYRDAISEVEGTGVLRYDSFDVSHSEIRLASATTKENYTLTIESLLKSMDVSLAFENFPLERLGKLVIAGSLTGGITVQGDLVAPVTNMNVRLVKGAFNGDRMTFNANAVLSRDKISLPSFSASYLDQRIDDGTGSFDLAEGTFTMNAKLTSLLFNKTISSLLSYKCGFDGFTGDSSLDDYLKRDFRSVLAFSGILVDGKGYPDWSLGLDRIGIMYTLKGGPENVINGRISGENGLFELEISPPFPIHASAHGVMDGRNIDSVIDTLWMDAKVLNVLLGEDVMKFTEGDVTGTDLSIKGIINDPDYVGRLSADDVRFKFFLASAETAPFHADFEFNQKVFSMMPVDLTVENGTVTNEYSVFYIEHWIPVRYELLYRTDAEAGLHVAYDFGAVNVDGYAIGTVKTSGDQRRVRVDGDLDVTFTKIMLGSQKQKTAKTATGPPMDFDINLRFLTRKKVEFYWPSFGFPVFTCIAKPQSRLGLVYSTEKNQFSVKGIIDILRGEIFFFNRNFHLQEGNISFNETDPANFDPRVTLRASIREFDVNNESVDIYFIAENNKLSELRPRFESVPRRSESEIYALLGGSIQDNFDSEKFGVSMVLFSSEILSQFGFFLSFEQAVRNTLNLDLFSIRTQVFQNILEQGMISEENKSPETDTLGRYLDDTTITFGRYLGDDLFLMGLVHLKEITDPNQTKLNYGFFGVEPEFELVLQLPTPFFNIEWSFAPKQEHIQDLFLPDTKIQFQWHYSY